MATLVTVGYAPLPTPTVSVIVVVVPTGNGSLYTHSTLLPVPRQLQPVPVAATKDSPLGSVSVTTTGKFVALGPRLLTVKM